jgi:hypothetical protein
MRRAALVAAALALDAVLAGPAARAQMPDPSQMAGRSLPAPEAPVGTTSVRVMRQTIGNNVVGQEVTLADASGATIGTRTTDDAGRATFDGLRPGTTYRAIAVVSGERLESLPFTQPAAGGLRVVLIAGLGGGAGAAGSGTGPTAGGPAAPARAAKPGEITLGTQSRLIVEQADEFVEVFVLCDLVNGAGVPVSLPQPIVFTVPEGAMGTTVLEGSTAAALEDRRVVVKGPLAPGATSVQFGYRLPSDTGQVRIPQAYPVAGPMTSVVARRSGGAVLSVAGERQRRDTVLEGREYVVVTTGAVAASTPLDIAIGGLPSRPRWPVRLALGLAGAIVLAGLVFGRARADDDGDGPPPRS